MDVPVRAHGVGRGPLEPGSILLLRIRIRFYEALHLDAVTNGLRDDLTRRRHRYVGRNWKKWKMQQRVTELFTFDGRMCGLNDGGMDGLMDGCGDGWVEGWNNGWKDVWNKGGMGGQVDGRLDTWLDGWDGSVDGRLEGRIDGRMYGRLDGLMDGTMHR